MEGNGGKERGRIWREEGSLVWITKWEERDLEGRELEVLFVKVSISPKWERFEGKTPIPLPFPSVPSQTRATFLPFLFPSFPFPLFPFPFPFPFPPFPFSLKLLSKLSVNQFYDLVKVPLLIPIVLQFN